MDLHAFDIFKQEGNWYKGNLHSHTTNSDGQASPEVVADWYYRNGYDFLAITDHDYITDTAPLQREGFLVIPGIEFGYRPSEEPGFVLDMLGINIPSLPEFLDSEKTGHVCNNPDISPQQIIDHLNEIGGLAIMCHPHFMFNMTEPYLKYQSYLGLEAYNYVCDEMGGRGYQEVYWDALLYRGRKLLGFATDDSHAANFGHAWIQVKASENTLPAIINAIHSGSFYSTTGIQIYDVEYEDGLAKITFDRPCDVFFMCHNAQTVRTYNCGHELVDGKVRYYAKMWSPAAGNFLRIELRDATGHKAYTNPVYF